MLFLALACVTTDSTPTETPAAEASPLVWEVHELTCNEVNRYVVPRPRVGLANYTVMEHRTSADGEAYANARIEHVPEIRTDTESWELDCYPDGYLLVVTYAYMAE